VAQIIDIKARGLYTHPNRLGLPPGSLVKAKNATIDKEDVIDTARGTKRYGDVLSANAKKLFHYADRLIAHEASALKYDSDGAGTWSAYSGSYDAPSGRKMKAFESNSNFYFTTDEGIKKLDALTATPSDAGVDKALDGSAALSVAGSGFLALDAQVAYRIVWALEDANENLVFGAPSQRIIVVNPSGGASADTVDLDFTIPDGVTTSHIYQVYRSSQSVSDTTEPDDELQLVTEKSPTSAEISAGTIQVTDSTPDSLRGATLYTSPSQEGIAQANDRPPLAKDVAVFKDHALFANTETRHRYFVDLITSGSPNLFYYAPTGDLSSGSDQITSISDMTGIAIGQKVTGTDIPADTTITAVNVGASSATMSANATGNQTGITITFRDRITVDAVDYWADSTYSEANKYFIAYSTGSPADDIEDTAHSLVKLINRTASGVYAFYLSGYDDLPGQMLFESRDLGDAQWAVTSSKGDSFSPILPETGTSESSSNEQKKNRVYIAKPKQPESVPILQYVDVGSSDDDIIRVIALRESCFFLKETEGVWRMTGEDVASFIVNQFDKSASIIGEETAVELNNQVWCYSSQGVISIADNGVQVWSRAIEIDLLKLKTLSNFKTVAFGVAYETDRKYYLYLPTLVADTYATQAKIYNLFTGAWTEAEYDRTCGVVNVTDDKLYFGEGGANYVRQERKTYTVEDYAEDEFAVTISSSSGTTVTLVSTSDCAVGQTLAQGLTRTAIITEVTDATTLEVDSDEAWEAAAGKVYNPIDVEIEWAPIHGGNPGLMKQFPEISFFFRDATFSSLDILFASNFSETSSAISIEAQFTGAWGAGGWGGSPWGGGPPSDQPIRTYVPLEQQRAHWANLSLEHEEALTNIGLEGFSMVANEMDTRF
jgi:hypothetical protein